MTDKILETLRAKNPSLPLYSVHDREFRKYGAVFTFDGQAKLAEALAKTAIPESGNAYAASEPTLESVGANDTLSALCFGGAAVQAGCCNGRGNRLNAMEYHRCSEINLTTTGLVLLLATPDKLRDGVLEARDVVGFYLPPDTAVEIFPMVMHFAPCRIAESGFNCLVVLEKGTNMPLERVDTTLPGEDKLLWMTNKWMTCHPDSPQAEKGAFQGIRGENITLMS
ncbi:MAG: DUF4867 family protein [Ruminococcaceae bacterium]|nr:DUF4867 family protein [Oscillospiraceae bacterium]